MTELTVLNGAAIQSLLTIPMAVRAVEQAYLEKSTGGAALWPMVFHEFTPGAADLDIKSGHMNGLGLYGMKVVSWFGDNPAKDLPALYGTSLLFDIHTGAPRALLNAGPITDFRTGAAGAVGAKYLARPDAETLLMAGTGALAPYLIAAALYCLPQLKTVYVANPHHPERSAAACAAIVPHVEKLLAACGGCHAARRVAPVVRRGGRRSHPQRPAQAAGGRLCACPAARRGAAAPAMAAAGGGAGAYGPGAAGVPARCGGMHALHRNDRKRRKYR